MPIVITQGDQTTITLTAPDTDLTGATIVTVFPKSDGTTYTISSSAHAINASQTTYKGRFTISLTAADTGSLNPGPNQNFYTKVTSGTTITHFHGHALLTVKKLPFP